MLGPCAAGEFTYKWWPNMTCLKQYQQHRTVHDIFFDIGCMPRESHGIVTYDQVEVSGQAPVECKRQAHHVLQAQVLQRRASCHPRRCAQALPPSHLHDRQKNNRTIR